jgi:hypothetical protein
MIQEYGPTFGVGDTVGCGVDYQTESIFYTLNGPFLGNAFKGLPKEMLLQDLYPLVGINTQCPVSLNFGTEQAFQFDLTSMVLQQKEMLLKTALLIPQIKQTK